VDANSDGLLRKNRWDDDVEMPITNDNTVPQKEMVVMSLKKILIAVFAVTFIGTIAEDCQAQNTFKRRRTLRWLGQGFSDGYHRCTPGHDTSYYNPYSANNSFLVSRTPEYQAAAHRFDDPAGLGTSRFFNGVPFSVYAAPPKSAYHSVLAPAQQVPSSFAPSKKEPTESSRDNGRDGFDFDDERDFEEPMDSEPTPRSNEDPDDDISDLDQLSLSSLFDE
jgi:hypothetical protein